MNAIEELKNLKDKLNYYLETSPVSLPDLIILKKEFLQGSIDQVTNTIRSLKEDPRYLPTILPCPFCGNTNTKCLRDNEINPDDNDDQYTCICSIDKKGCGSTGGYCDSRHEAIGLWNRRKDERRI